MLTLLFYITGTILQNHTFTYDEPIKVESVTEAVGDLAMRFGESTADEDALMVSQVSQPSVCDEPGVSDIFL